MTGSSGWTSATFRSTGVNTKRPALGRNREKPLRPGQTGVQVVTCHRPGGYPRRLGHRRGQPPRQHPVRSHPRGRSAVSAKKANPALLAATGVGPDTASALLTAADGNPWEYEHRSRLRGLWEGNIPGYPRFKPRRRWRSVEIPDPSVSMVSPPATSRNRSERWWRLEVKGLPRLRFDDRNWRLAAALGNGSEIAELRVVVTPLRTKVHVVCRRPRPDDVPDVAVLKPVGLDKGLKFRLTTSDGERVDARVVDWPGDTLQAETCQPGQARIAVPGVEVESLTRVWRRQGERERQADFPLAHRFVS